MDNAPPSARTSSFLSRSRWAWLVQSSKTFFQFEHFSELNEKRYHQFVYQQAFPIFRFTLCMGGLFTLLLTIMSFVNDAQMSTARILYALSWLLLVVLGLTRLVSMYWVFSIYLVLSAVFFVYYRYFQIDQPIYIVPTIVLLLMGLLVARPGAKLCTFLGFLIPILVSAIFVISGELNPLTAHIQLMLWFTAFVVMFAAIISEHGTRAMFKNHLQLQQARQKELEVGKAKSEFLASMSHEIRTPLTAVIGYAQSILEDDMPADKIESAVQRIKYNGDHLLSLVNDILDVAKIEQGKIELLEEETSLFTLMQEVSYIMEPLANRKGLQFVIDFQFPLPDKILIDRMRLRQILVNLIGNGIKFTEKGDIRIHISADEPWLRFDVIDSGIGIDSLNAQKIFKSFGQASAEITHQFGGTGLGLHISKKLANLMGGDLTFTSKAKVGSTFTVMIELKTPPSMQWTQHAEQQAHQDDKRLLQAAFSGHVLLADDVEDNRLLISSILRRMGLTLDLAENGREAIEKALITDYDLIFMDIQMPEMDGMQAVSQLRSFGNLTTVVALTANVMKQEVKQYLSAGFNAHLGKPIDRPSLIRVLERYLSQQQGELSEHELYGQQEFLQFQQRFINNLHNSLNELKQLIIQREMVELGNQAHAIRGSAASFEFTDIAELAMQLEKACSAGEPQFISLANKLVKLIENTSTDSHN
jgi:signal transduction histidine kinase/CheY-like chemotaxis protein/HPt (histidine-containing phosphotransfer) domain-containing protein